jgi:Zn-dependent M28 family amino/carboxypeptidase
MKLKDFALKLILTPLLWRVTRMPGRNHKGALRALTNDESDIREALRSHVDKLAVEIGERSLKRPEGLHAAAKWISNTFWAMGYEPQYQQFEVSGVKQENVILEIRGATKPQEIVVIGAHYDTVAGTPGADDNASGVAVLLELARLFRGRTPARTLRLVAFANEENPGTGAETMGSYYYAKLCKERRENVVGMLSLEMLGVYSDEEGSQRYPYPFSLFYPTVGNFLGFVGNTASRELVHKCIGSFRRHTSFPSEGCAAPQKYSDINRSDHWCFWEFGYPALMVTDTSNFRYPLYHTGKDTPDKLDFDRMARVAAGLARVTEDLVNR